MKVLMISGDPSIMIPGTPAHDRIALQRSAVEQLVPIVWRPSTIYRAPYIWWLAYTAHFDVVTSQDPFWRGLVGLIAAKLSGSRLQVQVHTDLYAKSFNPWMRMLAEFVLRRAQSIRVVSQRVADSLQRSRFAAQVTVLPIYLDMAAVTAADPYDFGNAYPQFEKVVLVVSRLEHEKNVTEAIEVMAKVLHTFPHAGLFIAGSGTERGALEAHARDLGIAASVVFLGHRKDIFSLYKGADVLLQTSLYEGYGAAVIEALTAGVPVVSPDVGIAAEAGARIAPREALAQTVCAVLESGEHGVLRIPLWDKESWMSAWRASL